MAWAVLFWLLYLFLFINKSFSSSSIGELLFCCSFMSVSAFRVRLKLHVLIQLLGVFVTYKKLKELFVWSPIWSLLLRIVIKLHEIIQTYGLNAFRVFVFQWGVRFGVDELSESALYCAFTSQGLSQKLLPWQKSLNKQKLHLGSFWLYLRWVRHSLNQIQVTPGQDAWGCPLLESSHLKLEVWCQHLPSSLVDSSWLG